MRSTHFDADATATQQIVFTSLIDDPRRVRTTTACTSLSATITPNAPSNTRLAPCCFDTPSKRELHAPSKRQILNQADVITGPL
jgi:hypothetical protein